MDAAVARVCREARPPAPLALSLATLDQVDTPARQGERQWQWRRDRAQDAADRARRRLLAVAPDHRWVAHARARDGNARLPARAPRARASAALPPRTARRVGAAARQRLLALAPDVPAVGHAPTTPPAERKPRLRGLINAVT